MKLKKLPVFILLVLLVVISAAVPVYAWLFSGPEDLILTAGDVEIAVTGWAKVVSMEEAGEEVIFGEEDLLRNLNAIDDLTYNHFVAFKFEAVNLSQTDAFLSVRFSPFSDTIFENFMAYYKAGGSVPTGSTLRRSIAESAQANTFKFVYKLSGMRYEYRGGDGGLVVVNGFEERGLWKYSAGEYFFDDVPLKGKTAGIESPVNLYFRFTGSQDPSVIETYREWLCANDGAEDEIGSGIGYGQRICARMLNSSWEALSDEDSELIDSYLAYFVEQETQSIKPGSEGLSIVNFNLKYFEFRGSIGPRN